MKDDGLEAPPVSPLSPAGHGPGSAAVWVSPDGRQRVYTRKSRIFLVALTLFAGSVVAIGAPAEFLVDTSMRRVAVCGVLGLGAWAAYRIHRMAMVVSPGLLTIRGFWGSRTLRASDIVRFEPPPPYGALRRAGMHVVLISGQVVSAGIFAKGKLDSEAAGVAEANELNDWLAWRRLPGAPPSL
jgi:hypothetical protein